MVERRTHPLTVACARLFENSVALLELYKDRDRCTDVLLGLPKYGAAIAAGKEIEWAGFIVRGTIIKKDKTTETERRRLHRLPSGEYLKITVRRVTS